MSDLRRIGKIQGSDLPRLLLTCYREKIEAIIDFQLNDQIKTLHLEKGMVVFARSNQKADRLGEFLVHQGIVKREDLVKASTTLVKTGNRLGRILVEMQLLSPKELFISVRKQISEIFISLFSWSHCQYRLHEDLKPPDERIVLEKSTPALVLEGVRRHITTDDQWQRFASSSDMIIRSNDDLYSNLEFDDDEKHLLQCFKNPVKISEILTSIEPQQTLILLGRLLYLGVVKLTDDVVAEPAPVVTDVWIWPEGHAEKLVLFNKAFRFIYRSARIESGIEIMTEFQQEMERIRPVCAPIFLDIAILPDGTMDLEALKHNAETLPLAERIDRLYFALNEYLYAAFGVVMKSMPVYQYRGLLRELRLLIKTD